MSAGLSLPTGLSVITGGAAPAVAVGTTAITGGTTGRLLYDNAGVLGETATWIYDSTTTGLTGTLGTIPDGGRILTASATFNSTVAASQFGVNIVVTSAGSHAFGQTALRSQLSAGYTGSALTTSGIFSNSAVGTGTTSIPAAGSNTSVTNQGLQGGSTGNGTGHNVGLQGIASAAVLNIGVLGLAQIAKSGGANIGVTGSGINTHGSSLAQVGGWFTLNQTTAPTVSAALIADNGAQTSAIFLGRDNGTTVFTIADGGNVTTTGSITVGSTTLLTTSVALTNGAAAQSATMTNGPTAGNPTKWIPIVDNGTTRYIPAW